MKRTALYEEHLKCKGKMVEFAGWEMPVQYTGILQEHEAVRTGAGIFDVSHMGEILVQGKDAMEVLSMICTNDIARSKDNKVQYTPVCYPNGKTVDDVLVYRYTKEKYLICTNASNTEKDFLWFKENSFKECDISDVSSRYSQIALQGPKADELLRTLTKFDLMSMRPFTFNENISVCDRNVLLSKTGYTGEDGYELYLTNEDAPYVWNILKDAGAVPAGLGARDTLRFEASFPLYGHEISEGISPLEGGLARFVKLEKEDFIGKKALVEESGKNDRYVLAGFEMLGRRIARSGYEIRIKGHKAGHVTSGTFSPTTGKNLGMAVILEKYACIGSIVNVIIRDKTEEAKIIELPFYTKKKG